jgi:hypothetical protein
MAGVANTVAGMPMKHRWALVVMGSWLAGTVCIALVAAENFYTIDRLLAGRTNLRFAAAVDRLGQPEARDLLRYLSSELNRLYFQLWNWTQLGLVALAFFLAGGSGSERVRKGLAALLAIVVLMLLYLTPAIVSLGRSLDFVARDPAPSGMQRFWILHGTYTALEMIKLIVGGVVTFWLQQTTQRTEAAPAAGLQ